MPPHVCTPACPVGRLRDLASADPEEALDLYINGEGPLTLQADITLTTGAYVQLAPVGDRPTERRSLQDMLSPRRTWAPAPAFPAPRSRDRYGVITVNGPHIFDLLPARATRYREDVAVLAGCHARELHITPARPPPRDVSFHGHRCYTVFTALPVGSLAITQRPVAAVIDARPLLRGWVPVLTLDGWLDSYPLLQELLASLPLAGPSDLWTCLGIFVGSTSNPARSSLPFVFGMLLPLAHPPPQGHPEILMTTPPQRPTRLRAMCCLNCGPTMVTHGLPIDPLLILRTHGSMSLYDKGLMLTDKLVPRTAVHPT